MDNDRRFASGAAMDQLSNAREADQRVEVSDSTVLTRLIEDLREEDRPASPAAYNRVHNRHNR